MGLVLLITVQAGAGAAGAQAAPAAPRPQAEQAAAAKQVLTLIKGKPPEEGA